MKATEIRRVEPDDGPLLKNVRLRALRSDPSSFGSTFAHEVAFDDRIWAEWAMEDSSGDTMTTLIAWHDGEPIGMVAAYRDDTDRALYHVFAMWVAPEARRRGVGRLLLQAVERWIADAGGRTAGLMVTDRAVAARQLYESAGYKPDSRARPTQHTPDLVEIGMRKSLC